MSFETGDKVLFKKKELVALYRRQGVSISYSDYLADRLVGTVWKVKDVPNSVWFDMIHNKRIISFLKKDLEEIAIKLN